MTVTLGLQPTYNIILDVLRKFLKTAMNLQQASQISP